MSFRILFPVIWAATSALSAWAQPLRYRADCRYHNVEQLPGVGFCYASALYLVDPQSKALSQIQLGVGCDYQTLYNDEGRSQPQEAISDRFAPPTAATPAVEVTPRRAFSEPGTYSSTLDSPFGRMSGTCYVQLLNDPIRYWESDWDFQPPMP